MTEVIQSQRQLAELLPALRQYAAEIGAKPTVLANFGYRHALTAALDGVIPASRVNRKWYWREADLPVIAASIGVTPARAPAVAA